MPVKVFSSHWSCRLYACKITKIELLHLYFPKSLIIQSGRYSVKQPFRQISSQMATSVHSLNSYD